MPPKPLLDARIALGDPEVVAAITLADQRRVLDMLGWSRARDLEFGSELWVKRFPDDDMDSQVIVVGERPGDRIARLGEMLHGVARREGIPVLRLFLMLRPDHPIA